MQLVLGNTQGELSPLEIGMHALRAIPLAEGGRGRRGGVREYAERVGFGTESLRQWRSAAEVAQTAKTSWQYIADRVSHLYEISKAPREAWAALVERLVAKGWTVADTSKEVGPRVGRIGDPPVTPPGGPVTPLFPPSLPG